MTWFQIVAWAVFGFVCPMAFGWAGGSFGWSVVGAVVAFVVGVVAEVLARYKA